MQRFPDLQVGVVIMMSEVLWKQIHFLMQALAESYDKKWRERNRKIGTSFLIIFLMRICFSRSQSGYQIIIDELWESFRKNGNALPQDKPFAASSVCEARTKLDPQIIHEINREIADSFLSLNQDKFRWHGFRLFVVDGSTLHLPPELKADGFGRMNPEMHYPQGKLSVLMHVGTGVAIDVILDKKGNEREIALKHFEALVPGEDAVIYDRGYFSYELALAHLQNGIDAIFRLPVSGCIKQIQAFIDNPKKPRDEVVSITLTNEQKRDISKRHRNLVFFTIKLRLIRYFIGDGEYIIATTILDESIGAEEFASVYHERWQVEEHYKACKAILSLESFHSKSLHGVLQEIYTAELLLTLSRLVTFQTQMLVALSQDNKKKSEQQIQDFVIQIFSLLRSRNRVIPRTKVSKRRMSPVM